MGYQTDSPSNTKIINSINDLPTPINGVNTSAPTRHYYPLANRHYIFNPIGNFDLTHPVHGEIGFFIGSGVGVRLSTNISSKTIIRYLGINEMFYSEDFTSFLTLQTFFGSCPNGKIFNITGTPANELARIEMQNAGFSNVNTIGTVTGTTFLATTGGFRDVGQGIVLTNCPEVTIQAVRMLTWKNQLNSVRITVDGITGYMNIGGGTAFNPNTNEKVFDIKETSSFTLGAIIENNVLSEVGITNRIFAANSKTQSSSEILFNNNQGVSNSSSTIKQDSLNNALTTTIATINTLTPINTIFGVPSNVERFVVQDVCTFNNTTDVAQTTFNHGLSNGDRVKLFQGVGTLPTGLSVSINYYVISTTATTFQLSLTSGGAAVDFSDNGSGTLYYRHTTGVSATGWVIYTGLNRISAHVNGWMGVKSSTGTDIQVRGGVMKSDITGTLSLSQRSSTTTVDNVKTSSSYILDQVPLSTGEGIRIYIENLSGTANLIVVNSIILITL